MNYKRITILVFLVFSFSTFTEEAYAQESKFNYAYIWVSGKLFSKKLDVIVDLGDTEEQLKAGKQYSNLLSEKKSYAAVLNHMVENDFELVETLSIEFSNTYQGTGSGGTMGVVFIMKKQKNSSSKSNE
jgi:hypothetical protein